MKIKISLLLSVLLFQWFSVSARAQTPAQEEYGYWGREKDNSFTGMVDYIVSIPTAGTRDLISQTSFVGFGLDGFHRLTDWFGLGGSLTWIYMSETNDGTFQIDNATITGRRAASINTFPILIMGRVVPLTKGQWAPYVGGGLGAMYAMREIQIGGFSSDQFGWQFTLAGEAGIAYLRKNRPGGVHFSARYVGGVGSSAVTAISYLSLSIGILSSF